ncbi:MAG: TonB-dependent receptor [Chlorobiaceae bacterium]
MNKKVFLVVMAGLLCSKVLLAEEQPKTFTGEEVVVSATKTLNSISNAGGASVTVITADDIKASGKGTVEELLKGVAGIDISSNGGTGSMSSLFIRGADAKNTLVLIDGVPVNDPSTTNRTANFSNLTLDNVEKIEVVRGSLSVLYGSNATAGVINIITRKGEGPTKSYAGMEGGSYGTLKFFGGVSGKTDKSGYSLSLSRQKSDGFSFADDRNVRIPHNGNTSEKDGYENTTLSGSYVYNFSSDTALETTFRYNDASVKYDDNANGYTGDRFNFNMATYASDADPNGLKEQHNDSRQYVGRIALKNTAKLLTSTLFVQFTDEERSDFNNDGVKTTNFSGGMQELGWQGDLSVTNFNTLTFGFSGKNESMNYHDYEWGSPAIDKSVHSGNLWLQDQWSISDAKVVAGLRYENNEIFGHKVTGRIAPSYKIGNTLVKASYGTGFLAPSLYQLYSEYGSKTLKPETSTGWDAGIEHHLRDNLRAGFTWFSSVYDKRIDFDMVTWKYSQVAGESKSRGIESFLEWRPLEVLQIAGNYTHNKTEDPYGVQLVRRPENKGGLSGKYRIGKSASFCATMQWVGERTEVTTAKDINGNSVGKLPDYFLLNLAGACNLTENVELYGRIDNVLNKWYEEAWGYATAGRSAYAGIKATF